MIPMTPTVPLFHRPVQFGVHAHVLTVTGGPQQTAPLRVAAQADRTSFDVQALLDILNLGLQPAPFVGGLLHLDAGSAELHFATLGPLGRGALREVWDTFGLGAELISMGDGFDDLGAFQGWVCSGQVSVLPDLDMEGEERDQWLEAVRSALERRDELEFNDRLTPEESGAVHFARATWRTVG